MFRDCVKTIHINRRENIQDTHLIEQLGPFLLLRTRDCDEDVLDDGVHQLRMESTNPSSWQIEKSLASQFSLGARIMQRRTIVCIFDFSLYFVSTHLAIAKTHAPRTLSCLAAPKQKPCLSVSINSIE